MSSVFSTWEPKAVWDYFEQVCSVPRASGKEEKIISFIKTQAQVQGLAVTQDPAGNLMVSKPPYPGYESRPGVILQGHVDMVAEKNRGVTHDFDRDPIVPYVVEGWVRARDTTLGADNGIAVAAMLAVLANKSLKHGPVQCLFTVDEEAGLTGAKNLAPGLVSGKFLLNLDSEDLGRFTIGCAGGVTSRGVIPLKGQKPRYPQVQLMVKGLWGGHSGMDIDEGRGNALVLAGRVLFALDLVLKGQWELSALEGGDKHNAIPREAVIRLGLAPDKKPLVENLISQLQKDFRSELGNYGKDLSLVLETAEAPARSFPSAEVLPVLRFLALVPDGVRSMSHEVPGLVESSCNLASLRLEDSSLKIVTSQRSSRPSRLEDLGRILSALYDLCGGTVEHGDGYPPWPPKDESPLLETCKQVWQRQTGKTAVVEIVHAGLECGLIGEKCPGLDMVSFGPDIRDPHTPQERLSVESVGVFWNFLVQLLEELG